jgi:hypothetical protein
LKDDGRLVYKPALDQHQIVINGEDFGVRETPEDHEPANLIGLINCFRFGLHFLTDRTFTFDRLPEYF